MKNGVENDGDLLSAYDYIAFALIIAAIELVVLVPRSFQTYQLEHELLNRGVLFHLGLVVRLLTIADITAGIQ